MKQVTVLGGGAWGTAIATLLAENGHRVTIWCYEKEVVDSITNNHINERYLPGVTLAANIEATSDMGKALENSELICEAVPVAHLRKVITEAKPHVSPQHRWLVLSKGIEQHTLLLPTQIIDVVMGTNPVKAVLSGPSFARHLAEKKITAVILAANNPEYSNYLLEIFKNPFFRLYLSTDMLGVQIGGALKNVMALGIGFIDGAGYTDNAKAFIFTRGLQEIMVCAQALGGRKDTLYGLAGLGDLFLTALGSCSRNRYLGMRLGQGTPIETILNELKTTPESVNTIHSTYQLIQQHKLDLPVLEGLYHVIQGTQTLSEFFETIVDRPAEKDCI